MLSQRYLLCATVIVLLAAALPVVAAPEPMTLGGIVRTAFSGCDNPTPVQGPSGEIYSNTSDCTVGTSGRISSGWVRIDPVKGWVPSNLTTYGQGPQGRKLSGAIVENNTLYLLERNLTTSGGMRVGQSTSIAQPSVTWGASLDFGWGSFVQESPDGYQYIYLRDAPTAYGTADRIALARVPKGSITNLAAWEVFAGSPTAPSWVPWANRAARKPVLGDPGRIYRMHVSYLADLTGTLDTQPSPRKQARERYKQVRHGEPSALVSAPGGCWTMAATVPNRSGGGLAVYTSLNPYGPWNRRYHVTGKSLGESAQFSPFWPGWLLLTEGDQFVWRSYSMPSGC